MKRLVTMVFAAAVICGCEFVDMNTHETKKSEPKTIIDSTAVLMMTSVRYPDGYDWKKDIEYGSVACTLFFETADSLLLKLPVGEEYERASDTDMHRIVGSSLFEDYSTDSETVLYKDGEELYRFEGREMITSIYPSGDNLYTLWTSRGKGGFTLRKNGETMSWSTNIVPVSDLYCDTGRICFSGIASTYILGTKTDQWYSVENGGAMPVSPQTQGEVIDCLREIDGHMYAVILYQSSSYFQKDREQWSLNSDIRANVPIKDMMYDGKSVWIDGQSEMLFWDEELEESVKCMVYRIWKDGFLEDYTQECFVKAASRIIGDDIWTLGYNEIENKWGIWHNKEITWFPEGYHPHSSYAMAIVDGSVFVALLDENEKPSLWKDGDIEVFDFNGYFDRLEQGYLTKSRISIGRN